MRRHKVVYVGAIVVAGFGSIFALHFYPDHELVLAALGQWLLSVLTFPLGSLASASGLFLIYLGLMTPSEATFVMTPVYAVLGYFQWCRLVPAIYRKQMMNGLQSVFR